MKYNHKGFGAVEVIVALVFISLIGVVAWLVWERNLKTNDGPTATSKTTASPDKKSDSKQAIVYEIPEGYRTEAFQEFGFSLSYPAAYGEMTKQAPENKVRIFTSEEPGAAFGPGISEAFRLDVREPGNAVINSRKYGPRIQLRDGKWIVVETNPGDAADNEVDEEYKDIDGNKVISQKNGSLDVYTFKTIDEGSEMGKLVFVVKGKLHELHLPRYYDGVTYSPDQPENDKTVFNNLLKNVRNSIRIQE